MIGDARGLARVNNNNKATADTLIGVAHVVNKMSWWWSGAGAAGVAHARGWRGEGRVAASSQAHSGCGVQQPYVRR